MLRGPRISLAATLVALALPASALGGANQDISVSSMMLVFDDISVGVPSSTRNLEISNDIPFGNMLQISQPTISGTHASDFEIVSDGCGSYPRNLAAGANCSLELGFTPSVIGSRIATLNVPSDDPDEPNTAVTLFGDGLPPPIVDLTIRRAPSGPELGDEVYEETPFIQILSGNIKRQRTKAFVLAMGNDGETGPITLLGCSGAEKGFKVTYEDTGTDITDDVVAGTYDSEIGTGPRLIDMRVKAKKSARGTLKCTVSGSAPGSDDDAIQVKLKSKG